MVAPTRRSERQRKVVEKSREREWEDDESESYSSSGESDDDDGSSASADEWRPRDKKRKKAKRGRRVASSSEEEEESDGDKNDVDDDDDELLSRGPTKKKARVQVTKGRKSTDAMRQVEVSETVPEMYDEDDRREAEAMWRRVREEQSEAASQKQQQPFSQNKSASQLDQWLGIQPPAWPATCAEAMINDRDSLFVGFAYTLNAPSQAEITQCLSHLTKVVQPQVVPTARLPPSMQHLATNRRGAMHDMYAWRSLALKKGRTGLGGPEDFGLEEGQEDDGERYGAKEIAKVIRMYGATDVLVVVSRWYGGTMLGPVRFRHIEECAKAALARYMVNEAMGDLRQELNELDERIAKIKGLSEPSAVSKYENLDPDRAQRLIVARKKQIAMLTKPRTASQAPRSAGLEDTSASAPRPESELEIPPQATDDDEAALEALNEVEAQIAADISNVRTMTEEEEEEVGEKRTVKTEPVDLPSASEIVGKSSPPVAAKAEEAAVKPVEEMGSTQVKDEQEDVDLTGWDEL